MQKIEQKLINFSVDKIVPFSDARVDNISIDTLRKVLHRLHDKGTITIVERGYFKKEKLFNELLFVYGSLKKRI
jgi:predicted transcriptional regulator of viral defense system